MGERHIFDREAALARMANSATILAKVVSKFKSACPALVNSLDEALARGDAEAFRRAAHSLKGAALNLGAERVVDSAEHLEEKGLASGQEGLEAVRRAVSELLNVLEAA